MKHANLALLAAAATGVQVGAAIAASRMVVAEVQPLTLAMLLYAIGLLCLLPFIFRTFGPLALDSSAWLATTKVAFSDLAAMAALGLGARLTDECIAFARSKGYKKMMLWTNSCLTAARGIYAKRGFKLVKSEAYDGFGQTGLVSETWELIL